MPGLEMPGVPPPIVAAPNQKLTIPLAGQSWVAATGPSYYINSNGQLVNPDGSVDTRTSRVDVIGYDGKSIWQKNADNNWYWETSPGGVWTQYQGSRSPPGLWAGPFIVGTVDTELNIWSINTAHQIVVDGAVDKATANVTQLYAPASGGIWQENSADLWYYQARPSGRWSAGTYVNPITGLAPSIWKGGLNNNSVATPGNWIDGAMSPGRPAIMNGGTININSGSMDGNILTIQPTTSAVPVIDMSAGSNLSVVFAPDAINPSQNLDVKVTGDSTKVGPATLNLPNSQIGVLTVTADPRSMFMLTGGFSPGAAPMQFIQHGGTFEFNSPLAPGYYPGGPPSFGNTMLIDGNLAGTSPITFTGNTFGSGGGNGNIEVTGSISARSGIYSYANGPDQSGVVLDNAKGDLGSITILNGAWLELKNMAAATSYNFAAGMLDIIGINAKLIAAVKLTSESFAAEGPIPATAILRPEPISVGKDSAGDVFAYSTNWAGTLAADHQLTALPG
jgi:hypothetical protein